jgi:hypothetical protein
VFEAAGIHHRDTENTEEQKTASLLVILYKLERTLGLPFFRSFAGFVNFVVSLGEDLGGPNIASVDPGTGRLVPLFNPRTDRWSDHFRAEGGRIVALTPAACATAALLRFADPDREAARAKLAQAGRYPQHFPPKYFAMASERERTWSF